MIDPNKPGSDELQSHLEGEGLNVRDVHGAILREKDDPRDGYEPIPLWMVSLFMALVFWGGAYLAFYSGGFKADVFDPSQVAWAGGGAAAGGSPARGRKSGWEVFMGAGAGQGNRCGPFSGSGGASRQDEYTGRIGKGEANPVVRPPFRQAFLDIPPPTATLRPAGGSGRRPAPIPLHRRQPCSPPSI